MFNFKMCLYDILQIYETHTKYKDKQVSITKSLEHYVKVNNAFDLITDDDVKKIKKIYKDFLINNKLPVDFDDSNEESDYEKIKPSEYSDSESSSSESNNEINYENKNHNNSHESSDDDGNINYSKNKLNKKCNNLKKDKTYHKSKRQPNSQKSAEDNLNDKITLNITKSPEFVLNSVELNKDDDYKKLILDYFL